MEQATPGHLVAGKYRVERVLKAGGMGVVVVARHEVLGDRFALKFLRPTSQASPDLVTRFLREAQNSARVKSDHAVRVFDVGTDGDVPYMVMELLEGSDLSDHLANVGPLPPALAVDWLLEACDAVALAHAVGIVHRDLKPSNLYLAHRSGGRTVLKVLDFGISKLVPVEPVPAELVGLIDTVTSTGAMIGTPGYMPPEQLRAAREIDGRADVWALGAILFEMLTAQRAFAGDSPAEVCAAVFRDAPTDILTLRPELPPGLKEVIARCLQKKPEDRYTTVSELTTALMPFASDAGRLTGRTLIEKERTLPGATPDAASGRARWLYGALIVAAAVSLVVAAAVRVLPRIAPGEGVRPMVAAPADPTAERPAETSASLAPVVASAVASAVADLPRPAPPAAIAPSPSARPSPRPAAKHAEAPAEPPKPAKADSVTHGDLFGTVH